MGHGPLAATDRRRQAGHKHPKHPGSEEGEGDGNGSAKSIAHLFSDRRRANGSGKRAS